MFPLLGLELSMEPKQIRAPMENGTVILRRSFNQKDVQGGFIRYWRVIAPATHRNVNSDLSLEGLIDWGIIPGKETK